MSTFILLAALASHITFSTSQQANMTTIIPQVTLSDACEFQVEVLSVRHGQVGQSTSRQKNTLF
ncbi:curli assembly chaperone CsgC, partial [Enterobacter hormaechei]